jgi:hypothetical protein
MLLEIVLITGQSVRGVASHFNAATPLDGVIFDIMGMAIFINTLAIVYVLVVFMRDSPPIGRAYLAGIRLGLLVFLLGSLVGVAMVMNNGHSVGVADGGPGLPFLNWSTQGGDLRAAHFIGMHALQLFPLIGYLLHRYQIRMGLISPARLTVVCCLVYTALTFFLFSAAMQGKPLVAQHPEGVPAGEITHTQR